MHKKIALTALTFLASITLAACSKSPDVTANATGTTIGDTLKIGVNLELTGAVAAYGNAENDGIKLAVEEINKAGGVDGKKIELVTKDNKSENAEASTAATNLAIQSQVNAMIGPATSGAVSAASLNAQKTGVPLLTPSGTQDDLTVGSDGVKKDVFRTTFQDSFQGQVLAQYAYSNLNAKKVVLYYDNSSDYAKGIAEEFQEKYHGEIVATATFASGDKDFQSALTKFKNLDYDAIVMPGYYTETGIITNKRVIWVSKFQFWDLMVSMMIASLTWPVQQIRMMFITYRVIQRKQHFQIKQQNLLQHIKKNTVQNQICLQRLLMTLFI